MTIFSANTGSFERVTVNDTTNTTNYLDGAVTVAGGMSIQKDLRISGSMTINGLLTVVSMSSQYVTSSQYNVGVSKITVNDDDNVRFAGFSVFDSGSSSPTTASIYWDSLNHKFLYENLSGSTYNSAILIAGPKNTGSLGNETGLTSGYVPYATGDDHIDNSVIYQSSGKIGVGTNNPQELLDIYASEPIIRLSPSSGTYAFFQKLNASSGNVLRVYDGSNYSMFWTGSNVGIGVAAPVAKLTIGAGGSYNTPGGLFLVDDGNTSFSMRVYNATTSASDIAILDVRQRDTGDIVRFYSGSTQVFKITGGGNVGIGTANPSTTTLSVLRGTSGEVGRFRTSATDSIADLVLVNDAQTWGFRVDGATSDNFVIRNFQTSTDVVHIKTSGNIGIGTTSPDAGAKLTVVGGILATSNFTATSGNTGGFDYLSGGVRFFSMGSGGSTKGTFTWIAKGADDSSSTLMTLDTSGRLLIGNASSNSAFDSALQIQGSALASTLLLNRFNANIGGPNLYFAKSRSGTVGTNTIVLDGDQLGVLNFTGADGTGYVQGALIGAEVDGTPGLNDMPGRLVFRTTADGASSSTERMRITSTGNIYTAEGSAISYGSGETYTIWNDLTETSAVSNDANWKTMKTFVASKSGTLKFKYSIYISSGTYYFAHRIVKNGSTVMVVNSYLGGLDTGESASVHAYRRFVAEVGPIAAGDVLTLEMVSTGGNTTPVTGNGQTLYAKEFRAYSTVPNVEHGGSSNIWGAQVGIGTTSPDEKLHINRAVAAATDNFVLALQNPTTVADARVGILFLTNDITGSGADGAAIQATNNGVDGKAHLTFGSILNKSYSELVRIKSDGNVGIGTTNPRGRLSIGTADLNNGATDASTGINLKQSSNTADTGIYLERSGERRGYSIYIGGALDALTFQRNEAGTKSDVMSLTRDGNVGIGGTATPGGTLQVAGTLAVGTGASYESNFQVRGSITAAASGVAKSVYFCDHTNAHNLRLYVRQDISNVGMWTGTIAVAYGGSTVTAAATQNLGNITGISVVYNNSGYKIDVTVTYTGSAPTIFWSVDGIFNATPYGL